MGALKTRSVLFLCLLIIVSASPLLAAKKASIVICAETGKVLHENNADTVTPPASLTKMMTLYLTFKALREKRLTFDQKLPVSKRASLAAPCKLWLKPGTVITVRDAILGMVTKSANDASIAVAEELEGSESHFATAMTQQARRLGMSNTIFKNSHGLPEKKQSSTTARDIAILAYRLYKDFPEYFKFFKEPKFAYKGTVHKNHNHLLGKIPGLDGIKTGFINASGFNLAASVVRDDRRLIAVVLGGETAKKRDAEMVKLLEATYAKLKGKKGLPQANEHQSIEDILYALDTSQENATSSRKIKVASKSRPSGKIIKAKASGKYRDVEHLLSDLDRQKVTPKKKIKGSPSKSKANKKPVKKAKVSKLRKA